MPQYCHATKWGTEYLGAKAHAAGDSGHICRVLAVPLLLMVLPRGPKVPFAAPLFLKVLSRVLKVPLSLTPPLVRAAWFILPGPFLSSWASILGAVWYPNRTLARCRIASDFRRSKVIPIVSK